MELEFQTIVDMVKHDTKLKYGFELMTEKREDAALIEAVKRANTGKVRAAWQYYLGDKGIHAQGTFGVTQFLNHLNKYLYKAALGVTDNRSKPKEKQPFRYYQCDTAGCGHERMAVTNDEMGWDDLDESIACTRCGAGRMWRDDKFGEKVGESFFERSLKPWINKLEECKQNDTRGTTSGDRQADSGIGNSLRGKGGHRGVDNRAETSGGGEGTAHREHLPADRGVTAGEGAGEEPGTRPTTPAGNPPEIDAQDVNGPYAGVLQGDAGGEIELSEEYDFF